MLNLNVTVFLKMYVCVESMKKSLIPSQLDILQLNDKDLTRFFIIYVSSQAWAVVIGVQLHKVCYHFTVMEYLLQIQKSEGRRQSRSSHFTPLYFSQRKIVIFGFIMTSMVLFPEDGGIKFFFFFGSGLHDTKFMCVSHINFN